MRCDVSASGHGFAHADHGGAGLVDSCPQLRPDTREYRGAVGGTLLGFHDLDILSIDVGLDLAPKRRTRTTTAETYSLHRHSHLLKDGESVAQAEGDSFENRADDVSAGVRGGETYESGTSVGVEMRCALTHEIRSPEKAVASGRSFGGVIGEVLVGITAVTSDGSELIPEPAQGKTGGLRYSHDVPLAGNRVTEGMQTSLRIESRAIGSGEHDARSADGGADSSSRDDSHAGSASCLIARAGDYGSVGFQSGCLRSFERDAAADVGRFVELRKKALVDLGGSEYFGGPSTVGDIKHQGAGGVGHVDRAIPGQSESNVVFGQHHRADAAPVIGLVLADPQKLRKREIGKCGIAGKLDDASGAQLLIDLLTLRFGANVAPDQRGANDVISIVEHHSAVHLAGEADARDVITAQARLLERLSNREAAGSPPVLGILLGPADLWGSEGRMLFGGGTHYMSVRVDDERARAAGSDVDAEYVNGNLPEYLS